MSFYLAEYDDGSRELFPSQAALTEAFRAAPYRERFRWAVAL